MTTRSQRPFLALFVAGTFAAAPLSAQGVEYAAGTTKYRVSTTTTGSQQSPMGTAKFEVGLQQELTVNLVKHAKDTVMATISLDSITLKTSGPAPDVSKLKGAKFVSLVSSTGKFYSSQAPARVDPQLAQITESVGRFLPSYRGNIAAGVSWSDTTSGKVNQQGMELDRVSVSNYRVDGDTTIDGERALRVNRVTTVKAAGTGNMQGQPVSMETSGNSAGAFFISPKGVYLGGASKDDVVLKVTILAQGAEINIKQNTQTTIETIK